MNAAGKVTSLRRVLVVTRNLPPLRGGMERLNSHVVQELAKGFRVSVVGPAGCGSLLPRQVHSSEAPIRPLWKFFLLTLLRASALAGKEMPHLFFAGSGLTAPITWLAARLSRGRCVVYLHGLDMIAPSSVYRKLWLPLIRRHDLCIVNSQHSRAIALSVGMPEELIRVLNPGVELPSGGVEPPSRFKADWGLGTGQVLLYVGRLTPRKGLLEFVQYALPQLLQDDPATRLAVIGEEATDAINGSACGYLSQVRDAADRYGVAQAICYLGGCPDQTLGAAYAAADVLVFPVIDQPGDVEGFGMVAIEAAAHGTPTVAFATGGIPDAVRHGVSGLLVRSGDYDEFVQAIRQLMTQTDRAAVRERCRAFAAEFTWESFGARLRRIVAEQTEPGAAT